MDLVSEDEDNVTDLLDVINQEMNENQEVINFERTTFEEGVLVGFSLKSVPTEQYVGKIIFKDQHCFEYQIQL